MDAFSQMRFLKEKTIAYVDFFLVWAKLLLDHSSMLKDQLQIVD